MSQEKKPVVAITIGDPAGIGPEITVATMMDKSVYDECKPFLIGSVPIISRAMKIMGCDFAIHKIAHPQEIANTILFLASSSASHITLQDIVVDGGSTLGA